MQDEWSQFLYVEYEDEAPIEDALWGLPWEAGITNTQDGLEKARLMIEEDSRPEVKVCRYVLGLLVLLIMSL